MHAKTIKRAFYTSLPVLVGYLIIGFGFGIVLRDAGYGLIWAIAMSLCIYAGSMQYVGISLITAPATLLTTILTTLTVNARHLFYSISLVSKYRGAGKFKPYLIFALTDETYALLSEEHREDDPDRYLYYFLVSLFNHAYWMVGTILGSVFAAALPFDTAGINFSMTALFISAYTEQWISGNNRVSAVVGLVVTLAARLLFGRDLFLIPSMIGITVILLLLRKKLGGDEDAA